MCLIWNFRKYTNDHRLMSCQHKQNKAKTKLIKSKLFKAYSTSIGPLISFLEAFRLQWLSGLNSNPTECLTKFGA